MKLPIIGHRLAVVEHAAAMGRPVTLTDYTDALIEDLGEHFDRTPVREHAPEDRPQATVVAVPRRQA